MRFLGKIPQVGNGNWQWQLTTEQIGDGTATEENGLLLQYDAGCQIENLKKLPCRQFRQLFFPSL
jgi:hypothetical protein